MAEKGAHLTQTLQITPSVFDYVAQDSLNSLLYPAAKKIATTLSMRNDRYEILTKRFNELYYIGHFFLQLYYLKKFGGTFSETLYGLRRFSVNGVAGGALTRKEILLSLVFCSAVPYLRQKLMDLADKIYFDKLPYEREKRKILLYEWIIGINKGANVTLQLLSFIQYLRYMSGKSEIVSPYLWASGLKLGYSDNERSQEDLSLRNFVPRLLRRSLEVSAFFLQFCRWWQTERVGNFADMPVPPPPEVSTKGAEFAGICPICAGKRKMETVLSVSGYVFCFKCISEYVMKYQRCPVTNLPATVNSLIRLYPPC